MLRTFFPWIIFYIATRACSLSIMCSAVITFVAFITLCHRDLRQGYVLSWLSPIFLISVILNALHFHCAIFQQNSTAIFYAALATVSWGSIIFGMPFTLQYSRVGVPQDKWRHPLFLEINYILSLCWAMIFSFNLSINWLFPSSDSFRLLSYVLTAMGMYAAAFFPGWYRQRWRDRASSDLLI